MSDPVPVQLDDPQPSPLPLVDLRAQYESIRSEIDAAIKRVVESQVFINGPDVESFEHEFGRMCDLENAIACANGTAALALALEAFGIGPGDEVVTTAHTFIATAEAIALVGATPVFADIDPTSYTIDPASVRTVLSTRTRGIIAVHIYGAPCDMATLSAIANEHGIYLFEDAAQAHLAEHAGRMVGSLGDAAAFSFFPGKNLGAFGDAGLVACRDPRIADRIRKLRDHGRSSKYIHDIVGSNQRMDSLQAAVLRAKLPHLPQWTARRRQLAAIYDIELRAAGLKTVTVFPGTISAYHLFVVEVDNRHAVQRKLASANVSSGVHYPTPIHQQPAFATSSSICLPATEAAAARVLSLPLYPELEDDSVRRVARLVIEAARI